MRAEPWMNKTPAQAKAEAACEKAQTAIQKILLDLEEQTGERVDIVDVDTRNFANCKTEIIFVSERIR